MMAVLGSKSSVAGQFGSTRLIERGRRCHIEELVRAFKHGSEASVTSCEEDTSHRTSVNHDLEHYLASIPVSNPCFPFQQTMLSAVDITQVKGEPPEMNSKHAKKSITRDHARMQQYSTGCHPGPLD